MMWTGSVHCLTRVDVGLSIKNRVRYNTYDYIKNDSIMNIYIPINNTCIFGYLFLKIKNSLARSVCVMYELCI